MCEDAPYENNVRSNSTRWAVFKYVSDTLTFGTPYFLWATCSKYWRSIFRSIKLISFNYWYDMSESSSARFRLPKVTGSNQLMLLPEKTNRSVGSCWNYRNTLDWPAAAGGKQQKKKWPSMFFFLSTCFSSVQLSWIQFSHLSSFLSTLFFALFFLVSHLKARSDFPSEQQSGLAIRIWSDGSDVGNQEILITDLLQFSFVKMGWWDTS